MTLFGHGVMVISLTFFGGFALSVFGLPLLFVTLLLYLGLDMYMDVFVVCLVGGWWLLLRLFVWVWGENRF